MLTSPPSFIAAPVGLPPRRPSPTQAPKATQAPRPTARGAFELVIDRFRSKGLTRGQAIREAVAQYPDLHQRWLAEINA